MAYFFWVRGEFNYLCVLVMLLLSGKILLLNILSHKIHKERGVALFTLLSNLSPYFHVFLKFHRLGTLLLVPLINKKKLRENYRPINVTSCGTRCIGYLIELLGKNRIFLYS